MNKTKNKTTKIIPPIALTVLCGEVGTTTAVAGADIFFPIYSKR
jgi:hypothetical protein